jgi:hypothetical protein
MNMVWLDDPGNTGWNPGTIPQWGYASTSIGVMNAEIGDFVMVSNEVPDWGLNPTLVIGGFVIRPNTVHAYIFNASSNPVTIPSATWHARVMKRTWMVGP